MPINTRDHTEFGDALKPVSTQRVWCLGKAVRGLRERRPEREHAVAQRPETVQARSLSPVLGGKFRVMARIPGLRKRRGGCARIRTLDPLIAIQLLWANRTRVLLALGSKSLALLSPDLCLRCRLVPT